MPVTQGLMLYVNSGRLEVLDAVTKNDPLTLSSMSVDVARQLLASAVTDDEFDLDYSLYPENSVGHAICGLMLTCFPDMEKDMLKAGYKKTGHRWLTAWDIPKPAEVEKKAPAPAAVSKPAPSAPATAAPTTTETPVKSE